MLRICPSGRQRGVEGMISEQRYLQSPQLASTIFRKYSPSITQHPRNTLVIKTPSSLAPQHRAFSTTNDLQQYQNPKPEKGQHEEPNLIQLSSLSDLIGSLICAFLLWDIWPTREHGVYPLGKVRVGEQEAEMRNYSLIGDLLGLTQTDSERVADGDGAETGGVD
ncbi:uncharacterized protein PAC_14533 [Phialocephala subalpina]|uniref:Uncharacterized protein n=1 Tax=Phialocephala subalpina TaxID=576137 RepID=A0A1L7XHW5_9HELO|nr:uncharacterized protein PAC_14533 [Phialocephala subalpina]